MAVRVDPEEHEIGALFELVDLSGREVLEIGCGDGRLTWRYAERTAHVIAIDPFSAGIDRANEQLAASFRDRIDFRQAAFEDFAAGADGSTFDVAILSWSLC